MKTIKLTLDSQNNSETFNSDGSLNSASTNTRYKSTIMESNTTMGYVNSQISINFDTISAENKEVVDAYAKWVKEQYAAFNASLATGFQEIKEAKDQQV